jgi:hypothetical protein
MPTDTDSGSVSGGPAPPPTPSSSNLKPRPTAFQAFEGLAKWLDVVRKIAVSLVVIVAIALATVLLVRETRKQALAIDPVIVQAPRRDPAQRRRRVEKALRRPFVEPHRPPDSRRAVLPARGHA